MSRGMSGYRIPTQDYNSLYIAVIICRSLVNTQTDSFWLVILLAQPAELKLKHQNSLNALSDQPILTASNYNLPQSSKYSSTTTYFCTYPTSDEAVKTYCKTTSNKPDVLARQSVATDDWCRVNLCLHKLIGILQQLSSYYYLTTTDRFIPCQSLHEMENDVCSGFGASGQIEVKNNNELVSWRWML